MGEETRFGLRKRTVVVVVTTMIRERALEHLLCTQRGRFTRKERTRGVHILPVLGMAP